MAGSVVTGDLGFFPRAHVGKLTACYSSSSWGFGGLFWPLRARRRIHVSYTGTHISRNRNKSLENQHQCRQTPHDYLYHTVDIAHLIVFVLSPARHSPLGFGETAGFHVGSLVSAQAQAQVGLGTWVFVLPSSSCLSPPFSQELSFCLSDPTLSCPGSFSVSLSEGCVTRPRQQGFRCKQDEFHSLHLSIIRHTILSHPHSQPPCFHLLNGGGF